MQLFPKSPKFFDLFIDLATYVKTAGKTLPELKKSNGIKPIFKTIQRVEADANKLRHKISNEADSTFITPIDREDIQLLAKHLDNIIDYIEDLVENLTIYKLTKKPEYRELTLIVREGTQSIDALIRKLKGKGNTVAEMKKIIDEIHNLELEGNRIYSKALKKLFSHSRNSISVVKWKDIFDLLNKILDECENTADVVNHIIIKNF
ncbi:DUF47 family protein [Candidatus Gottesmanbacteria bacterium]|nr:DUF47 family protein [Candidatus Gottesmanbacteria bacterium]